MRCRDIKPRSLSLAVALVACQPAPAAHVAPAPATSSAQGGVFGELHGRRGAQRVAVQRAATSAARRWSQGAVQHDHARERAEVGARASASPAVRLRRRPTVRRFGERNGMFIVGHTLVWHSQTPRWVFEDASGNRVRRDTLLARMRDHIHTVVGRYKGRIKGWDVVNEALDEDGTLRKSPWLAIIGADYIAKAFQFAQRGGSRRRSCTTTTTRSRTRRSETAPSRSSRACRRRASGSRPSGCRGTTSWTGRRVAQQDSTIAAFAALGVKVTITELDIDVLPRGDAARRRRTCRSVRRRRRGAESVRRRVCRTPCSRRSRGATRISSAST